MLKKVFLLSENYYYVKLQHDCSAVSNLIPFQNSIRQCFWSTLSFFIESKTYSCHHKHLHLIFSPLKITLLCFYYPSAEVTTASGEGSSCEQAKGDQAHFVCLALRSKTHILPFGPPFQSPLAQQPAQMLCWGSCVSVICCPRGIPKNMYSEMLWE